MDNHGGSWGTLPPSSDKLGQNVSAHGGGEVLPPQITQKKMQKEKTNIPVKTMKEKIVMANCPEQENEGSVKENRRIYS